MIDQKKLLLDQSVLRKILLLSNQSPNMSTGQML